jgi:RsiW-degrading membrane proteinase PrsW (M82 family)
LHWAFALALLPLCFSIVMPGETEEEFAQRLRESFEAVQPQGDPAGDASQTDESNPDESDGMTRDDLLNALPGHKLKGALLAYDSKMHWLFALLSVGFFLTFVALLASDGSANVLHLVGLGLFTATFGVAVLLVIQGLASFSAGGIRIRGGGVIALIYLVLMAIGWMYYLALSSDVGFVGSAIGFTFGVGLCEEVCKALPILAYYRMGDNKQSWRGAFLWGLASGVGFGVSEGMMYSADHYNGISGSGIYFVRFLSCVALHAVWAGSVGISINQRQHLIDEGDSDDLLHMALGVLRMIAIPMVLHGLYDAFLKQQIPLLALLTAAASFGYLAWQVSNLRGEDDQDERAAYVASYIRAKTAAS